MSKVNTVTLKNAGIYILTNIINNKQYVGMDSNIPRRFKQHLTGFHSAPLLQAALSEVGLENLTVRYIPYPGISYKALSAVEQWYIAKLQTKDPDGYNIRGVSGSSPNITQRPPKPLSPEEVILRDQIREVRKTGYLLKDLATEFDLPLKQVAEWCKGIKRNTNVRDQARKRRQEGATFAVIADDFGVAAKTVHDWCEGIASKNETLRREAIRLSTEENMTQKQIAETLGLKTHTTVGRWLKKANTET